MHEPLAARGHTGRRARVGLAGSRLAVWVALLAGGLLLVMVAVGQSAALAWTVAEDASVSAGGPQGPAELGEGEPPEPAPEGEPGPDDPVAEAKGLAADMGSDTASPATPMTVGGTPPPAPTGEQPGPSLMAAQFDHAVLPRAPTPAGGSQPAQSGDDGEPDPDALDRALRAGSGPQAAAPDALERLGFGPAGGDGAPDEQAASAPGVVPEALGAVASMPPVGPATAPDRLDVDWLELVASGQVSPAAAHELDWLRYSTYALSEVNLAAREDLARYMDQDVLGFPSPSALAWRAGDPGGQVAAARWLDGALHDPEQALDEVMHVYDQATRTEFAAEEWAAADDFLGWVEFGNEAVYPHAVLQRWYEFAAGARSCRRGGE